MHTRYRGMALHTVTVSFRGQEYIVDLSQCSTCQDLVQQLLVVNEAAQPLAVHTLKLLVPKHGAVQLQQQLNSLLKDVGVHAGTRCTLLGSFESEIEAVEAARLAHEALRLPDFDHEAHRAAQRAAARPQGLLEGKHRFGTLRVLPANPLAPPNAPSPSAALALLHKLATDPAIFHIMEEHGWKVPVLSEMTPEGKVGIDPVCVLGLNKNRGQEILLRLRTDDYAGFRKYQTLREVMVHELAHIVYGGHGDDFKTLNSRLLKEIQQFEAVRASARTLAGLDMAYEPPAIDMQLQQRLPLPRTLAATAGGSSSSNGVLPAAPTKAAAEAALARLAQQHQQQPQQPQQQLEEGLQATSTSKEPRGDQSSAATAALAHAPASVAATGADSVSLFSEAAALLAATAEAVDYAAADADIGAAAAGAAVVNPPFAAGTSAVTGHMGNYAFGCPEQQTGASEQQPQDQGAGMEVDEGPTDAGAAVSRKGTLPAAALPEQSAETIPGPHGMAQEELGNGTGAEAETGQAALCTKAESDTLAAEAAVAAGLDDVVAQKLHQAQELVQQLMQQSAGDVAGVQQQKEQQMVALQTVADVLSNLGRHPQEARYRQIKCSNTAFQRKLGSFTAAVDLLLLSGFAQKQDMLVYDRNDPGLVWLVLSAVQASVEPLKR